MTRTFRNSGSRLTAGFTLIELIVVIVIIGILAAVAAVSYNSFISTAENTAAEAEANQVATLLQTASAAQNQAIDDSFTFSEAVYNDLPADLTYTGITAPANPGDDATVTLGTVTVDGTDVASAIGVTSGSTTCAIQPGDTPGASFTVTCP